MLIEVLATPWRKGQTTNSTDAAYPAHLPTLTKPAASATRSIWDKGDGANYGTFKVTPYGTDSNNDVINLIVLGWNMTSAGISGVWVPNHVCEVQATLSSTLVGVANGDVLATELFADTLTLTNGVAVLYQGTGDQDVASFKCDVGGFEIVEVIYKLGAGAVSMNCLGRFE